MGFLNTFQAKLDSILTPICTKVMENKTVSAISSSMMKLMPVFIGGAIFSLIANFPITAVTQVLSDTGIKPLIDGFVSVQTNLQPIFLTFIIAYTYAVNDHCDGVVSGIFSLLVYFILMPGTITIGDTSVAAYSASYMGGQGIFAGMIISIMISKLYTFTVRKHIVFKLPESVPPMVSKSFEPIYSGVLIIGLALVLNYIFGLTSYGNFFEAVFAIIQTPVMSLGANVPAMMIFYTIVNLFWFFGIHPSALMAIFTPVLSTIMASNIGAAMQGADMPYVNEQLAYMVSAMGGTGCTLGLVLIMLMFAKSNRYKAINKLCAIPGICNINEPMIFGMPLMMNPIFFIPMVVSAPLNIGIVTIFANMGIFSFNAVSAMATPWTMPWPITGFLVGGASLCLVFILIMLVDAILYFPFFIAADRQAVALEKEEEKEVQQENVYNQGTLASEQA